MIGPSSSAPIRSMLFTAVSMSRTSKLTNGEYPVVSCDTLPTALRASTVLGLAFSSFGSTGRPFSSRPSPSSAYKSLHWVTMRPSPCS